MNLKERFNRAEELKLDVWGRLALVVIPGLFLLWPLFFSETIHEAALFVTAWCATLMMIIFIVVLIVPCLIAAVEWVVKGETEIASKIFYTSIDNVVYDYIGAAFKAVFGREY
jgi:hypothetical protein